MKQLFLQLVAGMDWSIQSVSTYCMVDMFYDSALNTFENYDTDGHRDILQKAQIASLPLYDIQITLHWVLDTE